VQELLYKIDNWALIKLLGGITLVLTAVIGFFSKYFLAKFTQSTQHAYDGKLEDIKGAISKNNNYLNSLVQDYLSSSQKILDKKIQAYELLWSCILTIKKNFPGGISLVYQLLPDSEIEEIDAFKKLDTNPKMAPILRSYKMDEEMLKMANNGNNLMTLKPYLSDASFKLFYTYQGLIGRVTHMFIWEYEKGKLYDWKKDNYLFDILKITLTEKELAYIKGIQISSLDSLKDLLEYKILQDFRNSLNIKDSTNDTVEYLKNLENILSISKK